MSARLSCFHLGWRAGCIGCLAQRPGPPQCPEQRSWHASLPASTLGLPLRMGWWPSHYTPLVMVMYCLPSKSIALLLRQRTHSCAATPSKSHTCWDGSSNPPHCCYCLLLFCCSYGGHILVVEGAPRRKQRIFFDDLWALDTVWRWSQGDGCAWCCGRGGVVCVLGGGALAGHVCTHV